jgi:hypothetical protein
MLTEPSPVDSLLTIDEPAGASVATARFGSLKRHDLIIDRFRSQLAKLFDRANTGGVQQCRITSAKHRNSTCQFRLTPQRHQTLR